MHTRRSKVKKRVRAHSASLELKLDWIVHDGELSEETIQSPLLAFCFERQMHRDYSQQRRFKYFLEPAQKKNMCVCY